jgi:hypothetical protein
MISADSVLDNTPRVGAVEGVSQPGNVIETFLSSSYTDTGLGGSKASCGEHFESRPEGPTLRRRKALGHQDRSAARLGRVLFLSKSHVPYNWPLQRTPGASLAGAADRPVRYVDQC